MRELSLEEKVQRVLDYMEVQNVMAKHVLYFNAQKQWEELDTIWAQKVPDVSYGHGNGWIVGRESLRDYYGGMNERQRKQKLEIMSKLYPDVKNVKENEGIGDLVMMPISTPCIEIAADGKTAKGVWFSHGLNTEIGADGQPVSNEMWGKCAADFIKEDGKWKIWHFVLLGDLGWQKDKSWVDKLNKPMPRTVAEDPRADFIGKTYASMYTNKRVAQFNPQPPEPYETWSDSISYMQ